MIAFTGPQSAWLSATDCTRYSDRFGFEGILMETEEQPAFDATSNDLVVFLVRRDTKCADCGCDLPGGSIIMLNKERNPLCLACADLDHLEFLRRGNTHQFTNYDELLLAGCDRQDARALIREKVEDVLDAWRAGRRVQTNRGSRRLWRGGEPCD
ncbi:MAG: DUF2293 domain-containing protein [Terrimicrobiaceae bacterium]